MSWKDQARRRRAAEKRGRRGSRRAGAMLLRQAVLHLVDGPLPGWVWIDEASFVPDLAGGEGNGDG
jgi:hypothetical protein